MGPGKNSIKLNLHQKINSVYSITMVHGYNILYLIGTRSPPKKNIFSSGFNITIKSISLHHHWKKYILVSRKEGITVVYRTLKNFNRHSTPPKNKILATVLDVHGSWNFFHRYSTATEKELVVATVLLWCTGQRNYRSVLCWCLMTSM